MFWFIRFPLYPEKKPERYLSAKKLRKMRGKLVRTKEKSKKRKNEGKAKATEVFADVRDMVKELLELIYIILKKFLGKVKIQVKKLDIVVATDDAAATALSYIFVCDTLNVLIDMLSSTDRIDCSFRDVDCRCDYIATTFSADVDILITIRIWQIIQVLFNSMLEELKKTI